MAIITVGMPAGTAPDATMAVIASTAAGTAGGATTGGVTGDGLEPRHWPRGGPSTRAEIRIASSIRCARTRSPVSPPWWADVTGGFLTDG